MVIMFYGKVGARAMMNTKRACRPDHKFDKILTLLAVLILMPLVSETQAIWLCPMKDCECPMNVSSTMEETDQLSGLFRGLFNNETDLESVLEQGYLIDKWSSVTSLDSPVECSGEGCEPVAMSLIDAEDAEFGNSDCCCESKEFIIKPLTVRQDNKTYNVVHIPAAPQLISISTCTKLRAACGSGRRCKELNGYTWILIYDITLRYYPPVKFVPIKFPSGCACVL